MYDSRGVIRGGTKMQIYKWIYWYHKRDNHIIANILHVDDRFMSLD
jgi:hypothetical protein